MPSLKTEQRTCTRCGEPVAAQTRFCIHCGAEVGAEPMAPTELIAARTCGRCHTALAATAQFCPACGERQGGEPAARPGATAGAPAPTVNPAREPGEPWDDADGQRLPAATRPSAARAAPGADEAGQPPSSETAGPTTMTGLDRDAPATADPADQAIAGGSQRAVDARPPAQRAVPPPPPSAPTLIAPPEAATPASPVMVGVCPACGREVGANIACPFCGQVCGLPVGVRLSTPGRRFGGYLLEALLFVVTLGVGWFVWSLIVWARGQTPAKHVLHMRVVRLRESWHAGWGRMFLREVIAKTIVAVLAIFTFGIIYFWLIWDKDNQELWDKIADTVVVDDRADELLGPSPGSPAAIAAGQRPGGPAQLSSTTANSSSHALLPVAVIAAIALSVGLGWFALSHLESGPGSPGGPGGPGGPGDGQPPQALARFEGTAFSIAYPQDWTIAAAEVQKPGFVDTTIRDPADPTGTTYIRVDYTPGVRDPLDTLAEQQRSNHRANAPGYRELSYTSSSLAGLPAIRWQFEERQSDVMVHKADTFTVDATQRGLAVLVQAPVTDYGGLSDTFARVVDSFQPAAADVGATERMHETVREHWSGRLTGTDRALHDAYNLYTPHEQASVGSEEGWIRGIKHDGLRTMTINAMPAAVTGDGRGVVRVTVTSDADLTGCSRWRLTYIMQRQADGRWLIDDHRLISKRSC